LPGEASVRGRYLVISNDESHLAVYSLPRNWGCAGGSESVEVGASALIVNKPMPAVRAESARFKRGTAMKKSLCIAAALALSACTNMGLRDGNAQTGLCSNDHQHCLVVTIDKGPGGAWMISVNNRELHVPPGNHEIFWQIVNTGGQNYAFSDDGIHFKSEPGKKEFKCQRMMNNPGVFKCNDPNSIKGRFEYGITVTGSPTVPTLDPFVVND
jgi:hypothetical protein